MNPVNVGRFVFAGAVGGALLGMFIKRLLPAHHISPESKDVARAMGMVATTVALVLGLLVYSAKRFYDTQTAEVTQLAANVVLLDRVLARYDPESNVPGAPSARLRCRRDQGARLLRRTSDSVAISQAHEQLGNQARQRENALQYASLLVPEAPDSETVQ